MIAYRVEYARMPAANGKPLGLECALFLSQAVYWSSREADADGWFRWTFEECEEQTDLSRKMQIRIVAVLEDAGYIETRRKGEKGTRQIRLISDLLTSQKGTTDDVCSTETAHQQPSDMPKGNNSVVPDMPKGNNSVVPDMPERDNVLCRKGTTAASLSPTPPISNLLESQRDSNPPISPLGGLLFEAEPQTTERANKAQETVRIKADFLRWYEVYPRKANKAVAEKAFLSLRPSPELVAVMISAVHTTIERARADTDHPWRRDKGKYIPHPASWINGQRWLDGEEIDIPPLTAPAPVAPKHPLRIREQGAVSLPPPCQIVPSEFDEIKAAKEKLNKLRSISSEGANP